MSGAGQPNSRAIAWSLATLLVLPALYVLSVPPVTSWSIDVTVREYLHGRASSPPWFTMARYYSMPYHFLRDHTPLQQPLDQYWAWYNNKVAQAPL